jgi:hypothetical protein
MEVPDEWDSTNCSCGLFLVHRSRAGARYTIYSAAPEQPTFTCGYSQVSGSFLAKEAKYTVKGGCLQSLSKLHVPWSAQEAHHEGIGFSEETIFLNGASPYRGQIHFTMMRRTPK